MKPPSMPVQGKASESHLCAGKSFGNGELQGAVGGALRSPLKMRGENESGLL